jgi:peptidoglycan/LPS O-acetylase OafA/YrhL
MVFVSHDAAFGAISRIGWVGVDLFFALSGYLIGNQIWSRLAGDFSFGRFYARRALRTLPNYLVVLCAYAAWPWFRGEATLPPLWRFFTFTQNLGLAPGTAFSHAWSLCIEEQFYLLFPLIAWVVRRRAPWAAAAMLIAGMLLRAQLWPDPAAPDAGRAFMTDIYYASWCRLDELVVGVLLAFARWRWREAWDRLARHGDALLVAALASTALVTPALLADEHGFWQTVFGYPALAVTFGLWILAATGEGVLRDTRIPGIRQLATWSYAIYLVHKQVCILGAPVVGSWGLAPDSLASFEILAALSVAVGWALHRAVEVPFLGLRDRWFPPQPALVPAVERRAA